MVWCVRQGRRQAGRAEAGSGGRNGGRESKKGGHEVRARHYHAESHRLTRSLRLAPGIMKSRWKALSSSTIRSVSTVVLAAVWSRMEVNESGVRVEFTEYSRSPGMRR